MSKFTSKSFDMCAVAAQDNSFAVSATAAAAAAASITIAHDGTNFIYITGIIITTGFPTANGTATATLAGLTQNSGGNGTLSFQVTESTTTGGQLDLSIVDPIPSKDQNTDVVLSFPALASGGTVAITLLGYRRPE